MKKRDFYKEVMCEPESHDHIACAAALEFNTAADKYDVENFEQRPGPRGNTINGGRIKNYDSAHPPPSIYKVAQKYQRTVKQLQQHERCYEQALKYPHVKEQMEKFLIPDPPLIIPEYDTSKKFKPKFPW